MTSPSESKLTPERNPQTHTKHRKEVFWQVTLPLILGVLLVIAALVALVIMTVNEARLEAALATWEPTAMVGDFSPDEKAMMQYMRGTTHRLSNVSQMWLLLPWFLVGLLTLGVGIGMVILVTKLLGVVPVGMYKVQGFVALLGGHVQKVCDALTTPVIKIHSLTASLRQARQSTRRQVNALLGRMTEE